jgi:hypothetical protein
LSGTDAQHAAALAAIAARDHDDVVVLLMSADARDHRTSGARK